MGYSGRFKYIQHCKIWMFYNMGRMLFTQKNQKTSQELILDLGTQNDGAYFLKISKDGIIKDVKKVILKK